MKIDGVILLMLAAVVGGAVYIVHQNKEPVPVAAVSGSTVRDTSSTFANTVVPGSSNANQLIGSLLSSIFSPAGAGSKPPSPQLAGTAKTPTTADSVVTWTNAVNSGANALQSLWDFFSPDDTEGE